MRRRNFIKAIAGSSVAWPLVARAQQPTMPVIGYLGATTSTERPERLRAFRRGLGETGFTEGQNVSIEYRWAEGHYDRFPDLALDLVGHGVAVIGAPGIYRQQVRPFRRRRKFQLCSVFLTTRSSSALWPALTGPEAMQPA
jgi:hypothetical protein